MTNHTLNRYLHRRIALRVFVLTLLQFFALSPATNAATPLSIYVVSETETPLAIKFLDSLKHAAPDLTFLDLPAEPESVKAGSLCLVIGKSSLLDHLNEGRKCDTLVIGIKSFEFFETVKNFEGRNISAIFTDPSPKLQLSLIRQLYNRTPTVLIPTSNREGTTVSDFNVFAKGLDINVIAKEITAENIFETLNNEKYDAVLLTRDEALYNQNNLSKILRSQYFKSRAVFGFSESIVKNGAAATIYYELDDITVETITMLRQFQQNGKLSLPKFSVQFHISLNEQVIKSLNLNALSLVQLENKMQEEVKEK